MIDSLTGRVVATDEDSVVLECSGIAFRLRAPTGTIAAVQPGSSARLLCSLFLRDEAFQLFGFATDTERETFLVLRGVNGLGPEKALALLSGLAPGALAAAVRASDAKRLQAVKGIGPRLAQRLVVELKDRLDHVAAADGGPAKGSAGPESDVVTTLTQLGYNRAAAEDAARAALEDEGGSASLERLVKAALRRLQRPAGRTDDARW